MHLFRPSLLIPTLSVAAGILGIGGSAQGQRSPDGRQFRADSFYVRDWIRGGSKEPDLFVEPREVSTTRSAVIVFDQGTREIHALDLASGATRFVLTAKGEGPGEFRRPMHMATTPELIGVLDAATSRLTVFSETGRYLWTTRVADGPAVEAMCLLPRGILRVKYLGALNAIATVDSTGRVVSRTSLPVSRELLNAPVFANSAFIANGCSSTSMAVTPYFGSAWYGVSPNGSATRFAYREPGREAIVTSKLNRRDKVGSTVVTATNLTSDVDPITAGAFQRADTVMVRAGATKRLPHELLDYYRATDGAYLYSRRLPFPPNALAFSADGHLLLTDIGEETSAIMRLSMTARPPRKKKAPSRNQP